MSSGNGNGIAYFGWCKTKIRNSYSVAQAKTPLCNLETEENCFWSEETSGATDGYGTKVTEDDLKKEETYKNAGWDFENIWEMDEITGYPRLKWEKNLIPIENKKIEVEITDIIDTSFKINVKSNLENLKCKYIITKDSDSSIVYESTEKETNLEKEISGLTEDTDYNIKVVLFNIDEGGIATTFIETKAVTMLAEYTEFTIIQPGRYFSETELFDGIKTKQSRYGAILLAQGSYYTPIIFGVPKGGCYINFSSGYYKDSAGESGVDAVFSKYNVETHSYEMYVTIQQLNNTQDYSKTFFEEGRYQLVASGRGYVEFDEWEVTNE